MNNFLKNVLYHFDFIGDKLIIGKFCQIATGVRFLMNGGNHAIDGFSTFPFAVFDHEWRDVPLRSKSKGDTIVGNDVWIGNSVTIMPGIRIGDGAIIATNSVVTKNVEPYTVVGGNPASVIRMNNNNPEILQEFFYRFFPEESQAWHNQLHPLEDKYWISKAKKAHKEGFVGTNKSEKLLDDLLNAED